MRVTLLLIIAMFSFGCQSQEKVEQIELAKNIAVYESYQYANLIKVIKDTYVIKNYPEEVRILAHNGASLKKATLLLYMLLDETTKVGAK